VDKLDEEFRSNLEKAREDKRIINPGKDTE
jgi:hypothetical protein